MTRVTAIVSAYFAEKYLEGRLVNLMQQTEPPDIVVICQNGSREEQIAEQCMLGWTTTLMTIRKTSDIPTIYRAWNLGLDAASAAFVTNANCDDRLRPNALEIMANELQKHPKYAVVYGNQEVVRQIGGEITGKFDWMEGNFAELMTGCFLGPMPMWRLSLHNQYGPFDDQLQVAGDYEFWLRIAKCGERFLHLRGIIGTYLDRPDSAEHRQSVRSAWETARVRSKYREEK